MTAEARMLAEHGKRQPHLRLHTGQVTAVSAGSPTTVAVAFSGNVVGVPRIAILSTYAPVVGDFVMAIHTGNPRSQGGGDWLVLGTVGQAMPWITVTSFSNGWSSAGSPYAPVGYTLTGTVVSLRGRVTGGTSNTTAFTLPSGYLPAYAVIVSAFDAGAASAAGIQIATSGAVNPIFGSGGSSAINLDGVSFDLRA